MSEFPRSTPYEIGESDPREVRPRDRDVDEVEAWCPNCDETRVFVRTVVDVSEAESRSEEPDVGQAVNGEEGWVCEVCGYFHRDLVEDEAYEYHFSDVGYHVDQFPDDEETVRSSSEEGVTPPERVAEARVEEELEAVRRDEEEGQPTGGPADD